MPRLVTFLFWAVLGLAACGAPTQRTVAEPPSPVVPADNEEDALESPWTRCYSSFTPTGKPQTDLEQLTESCGSLGGMRPVTDIQSGKQTERDPVDRFTFFVGAPDKCYRIFATSNVEDLDLILRDPKGTEILADLTHDASPVLPPREPACLEEAGLYILEVSVYRGSGEYALQVWGQ